MNPGCRCCALVGSTEAIRQSDVRTALSMDAYGAYSFMHGVLDDIDGGELNIRAPLRSARRRSTGSSSYPTKADYEAVRRTLEAQAREIQSRRRALAEEESRRAVEADAANVCAMMRELEVMTAARDDALLELEVERDERERATAALHEAKEERIAAEMVCRDLFEEMRGLRARNALLEQSLAALLVERESRAASPAGSPNAAAAPAASEPEGFNLQQTRAAVEEAVREAAKLPEEECKKKIRALRLKWHPDKHEVLKEIASEVTKCINEAVERHVSGTAGEAA